MNHRARWVVRALVLSLLFTLIGCGIAHAQDAAPEPPAAQSDKTPSSSKMICRQQPVTGSIIKKKTCRTQQQMDEEREASRQSMNDLNKSTGQTNGSGG